MVELSILHEVLKPLITPTNQSFSKPPKNCDIHFFKRKTQPCTSAMIGPIFIQNPFWISVCNHNSNRVNLEHGFVLFICLKPHISGLRFDIKPKNPIGCMYQFGICNYLVNFETFDYLNVSGFRNVCFQVEILTLFFKIKSTSFQS